MTYLLRLVTFIEGEPLIDALHLAPAVLRALGEAAGLVARALEGFEHPAADRAMQWDPRHVGAVVEALAAHVEDPRRRALAVGVADAAAEAIERLAPFLPRQIVHCDVTDWNVIGRRDRAGRLMPCGVIDFGDITRTLRVCELAVAASIAYGHEPDEPICAAAEIVRGFDAACPLDDAELEALPHLIAARAAIVAVGTEQQAVLEPHNAYAQRVREGDWAICEAAAAAVPLALAEAAFRLACGRTAAGLSPRVPAGRWPLPGVEPGVPSPTSRPPATHSPTAPGARPPRWPRSLRAAPSAPMARRACTPPASSRTPSPRRSTSASTSSPLPAARCGRRSRAGSSAAARASSCWPRRVPRCAWPASSRPSAPVTRWPPEPSRALSARTPGSCRRTCTCRSPRPASWMSRGWRRRRSPRRGSRSARTPARSWACPPASGATRRCSHAVAR